MKTINLRKKTWICYVCDGPFRVSPKYYGYVMHWALADCMAWIKTVTRALRKQKAP